MSEQYVIRVITDPAEALPGALRIGTPDAPERWRFGSYHHYWNEVEHLRDHRRRLDDYEDEAADARPSLAAAYAQRVIDHRAYIAMLEATRGQVAERYDRLADLDVLIHGFNANVTEGRGGHAPGLVAPYGRQRPRNGHKTARALATANTEQE